MHYPKTGITERLHSTASPTECAAARSRRFPRTTFAFFLGVTLSLAMIGASTVIPVLGFCLLLTLILVGMLLNQGEDG